jgi:hypothetical protein
MQQALSRPWQRTLLVKSVRCHVTYCVKHGRSCIGHLRPRIGVHRHVCRSCRDVWISTEYPSRLMYVTCLFIGQCNTIKVRVLPQFFSIFELLYKKNCSFQLSNEVTVSDNILAFKKPKYVVLTNIIIISQMSEAVHHQNTIISTSIAYILPHNN